MVGDKQYSAFDRVLTVHLATICSNHGQFDVYSPPSVRPVIYGNGNMTLLDILSPESTVVGLKSNTKEEVIGELVDKLKNEAKVI